MALRRRLRRASSATVLPAVSMLGDVMWQMSENSSRWTWHGMYASRAERNKGKRPLFRLWSMFRWLRKQCMHKPATPITVYFDGSCPLCRAEVGVYQKADESGDIRWCDVSSETLPDGMTRDQAMARFHVRNEAGEMVSGAKAFIALWLSLTRWRWLGRIASLPPLPWLLEGAYRVFLPIRPLLQKIARRI